MSAEPLRAGVLGFGWMGRVHAAAYAGPPVADLGDAVRSAEVLEAVELSARQQQWVPVHADRSTSVPVPTTQGSSR